MPDQHCQIEVNETMYYNATRYCERALVRESCTQFQTCNWFVRQMRLQCGMRQGYSTCSELVLQISIVDDSCHWMWLVQMSLWDKFSCLKLWFIPLMSDGWYHLLSCFLFRGVKNSAYIRKACNSECEQMITNDFSHVLGLPSLDHFRNDKSTTKKSIIPTSKRPSKLHSAMSTMLL